MPHYNRTLSLGTVPGEAYGYKRRLPVTVDVAISDGPEPRLSICGNVWRPDRKDILGSGQNHEEIAALFPDDPRVQRIVKVWRRWHLNDMRAGCEHQRAEGGHGVGDVCPIDGYRYGSAWLYEELPDKIIAEVKSWS
jgi:hypothetical protein